MERENLECLVALGQERDWTRTAERCGVTEERLNQVVHAAEEEYGHPIVVPGRPFQGFTPEGERVLAWAKDFCAAFEQLAQCFATSRRRTLVAPLLERRSVSPKRLTGPGPSAHDLALIAQAGLHAPDHGGLHPWRLLEFAGGQRAQLADCFEAEKRRRDPLAPAADLQRAREHALRPPVLLAFIVSPKARTQVPLREQWLSAGAALGNMLNAAHQLGFGAIVLSGERCFDPQLSAELGLQPAESLAGFISLGSVVQAPPARQYAAPEDVLSHWQPHGSPAADAPHSPPEADLEIDPTHDDNPNRHH
jgi:nitroreductase